MFKFNRSLILPLFLGRNWTVYKLARLSGVSFNTARRAVDGLPIQAAAVQRIADALGVNVMDFLDPPAQKTSPKEE